MSKKFRWMYADSANHSVGTMICTHCQKPIKGQFRFRETEDAYLPQHRACSEGDPKWDELDKERADLEREHARAPLPCPFCGGGNIGERHVATYSLDSSFDFYGCLDCGNGFIDGDKLDWNRRVEQRAAGGAA